MKMTVEELQQQLQELQVNKQAAIAQLQQQLEEALAAHAALEVALRESEASVADLEEQIQQINTYEGEAAGLDQHFMLHTPGLVSGCHHLLSTAFMACLTASHFSQYPARRIHGLQQPGPSM